MTDLENSLPWYKKGLNFKCTQCGQCCTGAPGFVWISEEEMQSIADYLQVTIHLFKRTYVRQRDNRFALVEKKKENNACIFLKDKKCQIYPVRPKQCKTFPWWKENLNTEESWRLAAEFCEGISKESPLVSFSEIQTELKKTQCSEKK